MKFRGIWSHDCSWLQVNRRKYQSLRKENFLRLFSFFSLNLRLIENVDLKSLVFFSFKSCHENVNLKSSVFFLLSHVMKIWLTHNVARPSVGLNNCDDQSFISYLLRFPIESVLWKTHTEIFSSNHNRESTFSHVEKPFHPIRNQLSEWISQFANAFTLILAPLQSSFTEVCRVSTSLLKFSRKFTINHRQSSNRFIALDKPIKKYI